MKTEPRPRKARLMSAYEEANTAYSQAVAKLERNADLLMLSEYEAAFKEVEALRTKARTAQEQLTIHVAQHSC
jgi:DNA/RNA-binding domain of Phe-tRNA-synthetase-like protein